MQSLPSPLPQSQHSPWWEHFATSKPLVCAAKGWILCNIYTREGRAVFFPCKYHRTSVASVFIRAPFSLAVTHTHRAVRAVTKCLNFSVGVGTLLFSS